MRRQDETGSASVLVVAACLVVLAAALGAAAVLSAGLARQRAETAADLAALAGAASALQGGDGCARAAAVAAAQGARLTSCSGSGVDVVVQTEVALPVPARWWAPTTPTGPVARSRSRAGAVP